MTRSVLLAVVIFAPTLHARGTFPQCGGAPHFEYQVERQARFLPDSALDIFPIDTAGNPRNYVQFVVDTAGHVIRESFHPRKVASAAELDSAMLLIDRWRYAPATLGGRPECQLILTYLKRSSSLR